MRKVITALVALLLVLPTQAGELKYKNQMLAELVQRIPRILKTYDPVTGRFGNGIWICSDQHPMYPLAVVYATPGNTNPYHKDPKILAVVAKAAQPLIAAMDKTGQWRFDKKDGSYWGMIRMPWTYSRWIRTFQLVRDDLSEADRQVWTQALTLGYGNIAKHDLRYQHNIATHHAMGLYLAGKTFDRPEWRTQAAEYLMKTVARQAEGGYWSEHVGPLVAYNTVYVDALGTYYSASRDERVLIALQRGAAFHEAFTYPDGTRVETVDERNPYHDRIDHGNIGLSITPVGRSLLKRQWGILGWDDVPDDAMASFLQYGHEGLTAELTTRPGEPFILREDGVDRAAVIRTGPWFICFSAFTAVPDRDRWHQDRQNLVSIWHQRAGLILGGGNTRLQPAWSNFTVGDCALLRHKPGDTKPDFRPKGELYHIPSVAELITSPHPGLKLTYGPAQFQLQVEPQSDSKLEYRVKVLRGCHLPLLAHLTLLPHLGQAIATGAGKQAKLTSAPFEWSPKELTGGLSHAGWRAHLPPSASLHWPALPHNPYRIDGRAAPAEGRIEIRIPLDEQHKSATVMLEVPPK